MCHEGEDLQREPLNVRKATLASLLLSRTKPGLRLNEHLEHEDGAVVFAHACRMGLEGIVSKRKDSRYSSGLASLDQEQESQRARSEAGTRRGLGKTLQMSASEELLSAYLQNQALERAEDYA